jgi:hypothetical protein
VRGRRPGTESLTPKLHKNSYKSRKMYTSFQTVIKLDKIFHDFVCVDGSTAPTTVGGNTAISASMCSALTCVSRQLPL